MKPIFYLILTGLTFLVAFQVYALVRPASERPQPDKLLNAAQNNSQEQPPELKQPKPARLKNLTANIIRRNLFNVQVDNSAPDKRTAPKPVDTQPLEKTNLKLTLWGTVTGKNKEDGWAVIEDLNNKKQDLYRVNDNIQGGTIRTILRSRVILTVNGKDQILEASTDSFANKPGLRRPSRSKKRKPSEPPKIKKPENAQALMEEMSEDAPPPIKETSQFKSRAYFKDGEAAGVMIYGIRGDSGAKELGLRNGDVVQSVDDVEIKSIDDFEAVAESIDGDSDITLSVLRRGKPKEIVYNAEDKTYAINDVEE